MNSSIKILLIVYTIPMLIILGLYVMYTQFKDRIWPVPVTAELIESGEFLEETFTQKNKPETKLKKEEPAKVIITNDTDTKAPHKQNPKPTQTATVVTNLVSAPTQKLVQSTAIESSISNNDNEVYGSKLSRDWHIIIKNSTEIAKNTDGLFVDVQADVGGIIFQAPLNYMATGVQTLELDFDAENPDFLDELIISLRDKNDLSVGNVLLKNYLYKNNATSTVSANIPLTAFNTSVINISGISFDSDSIGTYKIKRVTLSTVMTSSKIAFMQTTDDKKDGSSKTATEPPHVLPTSDPIIFDDALHNDWHVLSWGSKHENIYNITSNDLVMTGKRAISVQLGGAWSNIAFEHDGGFYTTGYKNIVLGINGGTNGNQRLLIELFTSSDDTSPASLISLGSREILRDARLPANKWVMAIIPLAEFGGKPTLIKKIMIITDGSKSASISANANTQNDSDNYLETFYLDEIWFTN